MGPYLGNCQSIYSHVKFNLTYAINLVLSLLYYRSVNSKDDTSQQAAEVSPKIGEEDNELEVPPDILADQQIGDAM